MRTRPLFLPLLALTWLSAPSQADEGTPGDQGRVLDRIHWVEGIPAGTVALDQCVLTVVHRGPACSADTRAPITVTLDVRELKWRRPFLGVAGSPSLVARVRDRGQRSLEEQENIPGDSLFIEFTDGQRRLQTSLRQAEAVANGFLDEAAFKELNDEADGRIAAMEMRYCDRDLLYRGLSRTSVNLNLHPGHDGRRFLEDFENLLKRTCVRDR